MSGYQAGSTRPERSCGSERRAPHEWGVHIDGLEVFHEIGGRVDIDSCWVR